MATCANDQNGPTRGGVGYFGFRPVYGISGSLSQFGIVADSVHVRLTRPVDQLVLDTTVFFPADSTKLTLALPVPLETSPETLTAVIGISAGSTLLFSDSLDVAVVDGPPSAASIPTVVLDYVGPGKNVKTISIFPGDTTVVLQDTLFFTATATDSLDQPVASFFVGWKTSDTNVAKINGNGRLIAPNLRGTVRVIGTTPTGIADTTTLVFAPVPSQILADSGAGQSGIVPDSLAALFVAQVLGSDDLPIEGVKVRWTAVTAGGAVRDTILYTDANGRVRTRGVLGDTVRTYSYSANVVGTALTTTFTATATAGTPSAIAIEGGNAQTDSAGRVLPLPFVAKVTDAYGNVVAGATVSWARTLGGGTVSADTTLTDASGLTSITYTLGAVGTDSVTATLAGTGLTATFGAIAINGAPATVSKSFGDAQADTVGQLLTDSLVVVVTSATGQPVVGGSVSWTILRGGSSSLDTSVTDVNGRTAVAYTLGTTAGIDSVQAQAGNVTAVFQQTAAAATATAIAIFSGDAQTDTTGRPMAQPLVVAVTDSFGNPVLNAPVTFVRIAGAGTPSADTVSSAVDNHPGVGYTLGLIPGTDSIRATLLANGSFVTFTATGVAGTPATVTTVNGDSQTVVVGAVAPETLVVRVRDAAGNPVVGQRVDWSVIPAVGDLVPLNPGPGLSSISDTLGQARAIRTAGSVPGTVRIEAQAGAVIDSIWVFEVAGAASAIAIQGGDAQVDTTGHLLPLPFVVKVTDALGNPISGATVYWTQVAGGGVRSADSTLTDSTGQTSITYTLGNTPGADTVRATVAGTPASIDFTAGTISAAPTGIQILLGDAQTDTAGATLTDSLVVRLVDGSSNPIPDTWLYWTTAGITLSADSTLTDGNGRAAVQATLGTVAAKLVVLAHNADTTLGAVFHVEILPGAPASIAPIAGNSQTGTPNTPLALPFRVLVQDAHGNLADSVGVTWQVQHGSGSILPDTGTTDSLGFAEAQYTAGPTAGSDTIVAKALGTSDSTIFVADVGAGAASALSYLAGTGQSDTIGATLAPFIVSLRDASNNPVAGQYVRFTRIAGSGTVQADSSLTDPSGTASTTYLLGTAAGLDSVIATTAGVADTVTFYAQTNVGAPQQLLKFDGDSQSAAIGAQLPAPLRAQVRDRGGNAVAGVTVDYAVAGGAVNFANASPTSDPSGLAPTGTVTIGAGTGSFDITATTAAIPADTVHFTVIALPIGTSKQWLGTLSGIWGTAGNWSPAGIPSAADNIFIPVSAANQPVLDAAYAVGGLQVESGANVALGAFSLTANGATQIDGAMSHSTGVLILAGSATSARGNFTATRVTGTITLAGATTVADSLAVSSGSLNIGGQQLAINGALDVSGTGAFTMQNPADSVTVTGATTWNGTTAAGLLQAGHLVLQGDLSVPTGSAVFQALAGHQTILAGSAPQTVTFGAASLASNHFGGLIVANPGGVTLGGDIAAAGDVLVNAGVVTGAGRTAILAGGLLDPTSTGWNVGTTSVAGLAGFFPDTILGNLDVTGTLPLLHPLVVKGNYAQSSGTFNPDGFSLRVEGTTTLTGTTAFTMQSPSDSVDLVGAVSWNGTTTPGLLIRGTLVLRNSFTVPTGSAVFQASGTHTTVFAGAAAQSVNISGAAVGTNFFNDLVVANPAGVQLQSDIATFGRATITAGTLTGAHTAFIGTGVVDPTNVSWLPDMTDFTGTVAVHPDSLGKGVTVSGGMGLLKPLVVKGPMSVVNTGFFDLNGFTARFDSTLTVSGSAQFEMLNPADSLDVAGTVSWNGSTATGLLGSGTLVLRGNMSVPTGSSAFQPNGSHRTILAGSAPQTIDFGASGLTGNRFNQFTAANPAGVTFTSDLAFTGNVAVTAGTVTAPGHTLFLNGNLSDPTSVAWQPDLTELDGTPGALPDSFAKGLIVNGTVTLGHPIVVKGPFSVTNSAVFTLNGFRARIDSSFALTGGAQVKLQNPADTLDIHGSASWNGSTLAGLLTAGTTIFRGDFSEPTASRVYSATGTHTTIFAGTTAQTVTFGGPGFGANEMHDVQFANPAGVQFTSNAAINGTATMVAGAVTGPAQTITVGETVVDSIAGWAPAFTVLTGNFIALPDSFLRNLELRDTIQLVKPLVVKGNVLQSQGRLTMNGQALRVDSALTITGSSEFVMQDPADSVDIGGMTTWNGSTTVGLLSNGALVLRGGFSVPTASTVFQPTGGHRTIFDGPAIQNVGFGAPSMTGNRFNGLEFRGTGAVALSSDIFAAGTLTKAAGATSTLAGPAGYHTVTTRGLSLDGMTFDSVRVVSGGPSTTVFNNVAFLHQDPTATQLTLVESGTASPVTFTNVTFGTVPTTGKVMAVSDTGANGSPLHILMSGSTPLDGSAFTTLIGGGDGATVDWSHLAFVVPPSGAAVGATLAPISVAVLGPLGDTLTTFAGNITVALAANPGAGTLLGTTTQAVSSGVATFADLDIDVAALGYSLSASAAGLGTITSGTFDITLALPVGFQTQWLGGISTDWSVAGNWSGGVVPDSSVNVFIGGIGTNAPSLLSGTAQVNRLLVAAGATLSIAAGDTVIADSTVEAFGSIAGSGTLLLSGTGDISGNVATSSTVFGTYAVAGTASFGSDLTVGGGFGGSLTVGPDTLAVAGQLQTVSDGIFAMVSPAALVDVTGPAQFSGGTNTLSDGTLRLSGDLSTGGERSDVFAPSASHITVLNGSSAQQVTLAFPDSTFGSHFGRLQVSTNGTATMNGRYDAMGDLLVTTGATLADTMGFNAHGLTSVDAGGALEVRTLRMEGNLGVAVGATYAVARTEYAGPALHTIDPAPYDTLVIETGATAGADLLITGDLLIDDGLGTPGRFSAGGHTVTISGSVNINGDGALVMQDPADTVKVAGSFFTNGTSTDGLLTAGWLRIGGSFRQAADGSGKAFRAGPGHTTEFFAGGPTGRSIEFDSPTSGPTDSAASQFGALLLPEGFDTLVGRVPAAGKMFLAAALYQDTTQLAAVLAGYDSVYVSSASPSMLLRTLEVWGGLGHDVGAPFNVVNTRLYGGSGALPALPYQNLAIAYTGAYTLGTDLTLPGTLDVGIFCSEVCSSQSGALTVGGHTLAIGGAMNVTGLGHLTMAAGDSVDVTGPIQFRTTPEAGHFTGGTLVARGMFNTVGSGAFQADSAHRTVMLAAGVEDIYPTTNTWFGKLYLLDAAPRRVRTGGPLVVLDSLVLGSATSGLNDTLGFGSGTLVAQGPVFTVVGSSIRMDGVVEFDHDDINVLGDYAAANTIFGGSTQPIPALAYTNVTVTGTAALTAPLDIGNGSFIVNGTAGSADIDLNGQALQVGDFTAIGNATLTSTAAGSDLLVRGNATFNGGDETGLLTNGRLTLKGDFTQDSLNSPFSYVSSGSHRTVFADSSFGGSHAIVASMGGGQSRFNLVEVYGTGLTFFGDAWVAGDLGILDPLVDSVGGGIVRVAGTIGDANHEWKVDTTVVVAPTAVLPDSIDGNLWFEGNYTLGNLLRVGGEVQVLDTVVINGYTLVDHGALNVSGAGLLQMTNGTDEVQVDGVGVFNGAPTGALMSAGRLTLRAGLDVPSAGQFNATGTHTTVLAGSGLQSLTIDGSTGNGFNDLVVYAPQLSFNYPMLVHGTFADSVTTSFLSMSGGTSFEARQAELQNVQFTNTTLTIGDSSQVDSVSIYQAAPEGLSQLTIRGAGRTTPLDLSRVMFFNLPTTGKLLQVTDTAANGDSIVVRMFGSTPFNGTSLTVANGEGAAEWGTLALDGSFPVTVDSAVSFGFGLVVKEPDGSDRSNVVGSADVTLAANPFGATLGGTTTATFDGSVANFFNLTLDGAGLGVSFHVQMQGQPLDSFTTPTLDVLNPAPLGAIIWDGSAGNGLWSDTMNWSTGTTPTAGDSVFIGAGQSVTFNTVTTIGGLVLGQGASLDLQGDLTVTGRVTSGNSITSASNALILKGTNVAVSGTLPRTTVVGTAVATGPITVAGDLMIDSTGGGLSIGSAFDLNGHRVDVNGSLWTRKGGLFTMTSPADTLTIDGGSFSGGDETGHLTDGVLFIKSSFDQAGGDPNSFHTSGNHTTVFPNTGSSAFADISSPGSSQFANLRIENPAGVDLNESGAGWVRVAGDLTLSGGGVATGDTVIVGGAVTLAAPGDSLALALLRVSGALNVAGGYNVPITELAGTGATVAGTTGGYQALNVTGIAALSGPVVARSVTVVAGGSLDVNGRHLTVDSLFTDAGVGDLLMDGPADTVIVNTLAQFTGTTPATPMTAGYLEIRGDLDVAPNWNAFVATAGHVLRFAGAPVHTMDFPGEGNATPLGTVVIDSGTVLFTDDALITGDLILHNGLLADSSQSRDLLVRGSVLGDNGPSTELLLGRLTLQGALTWQGIGLEYHPATTEFAGTGQVIPQLPYTDVVVSGTATLGSDGIWAQGTVDSAGVLTLGGHTLSVTTNTFLVTDSARLIMHDPADTLAVAATAIFSTDANTLGDYTAGAIRARHFTQVEGSFGGLTSFVQSGSNRLVPQAGDTIEMASPGPADSRLATIDFSTADGPVTVRGAWISDSMLVGNPLTTVAADTGFLFAVAGAFHQTDGAVNIPRLALSGAMGYVAGTYTVDTTVFFGAGQVIPNSAPYANVVVQNSATLGGDLDLLTGGHSFRVANSGDLDLGGHLLQAQNFGTTDFGVLTMHSAADTLRAATAVFGGGSTVGHLTAGAVQVGTFHQNNDFNDSSYAPSGTHATDFVNLGLVPEGGAPIDMVALPAGSHFNILHIYATGPQFNRPRLFNSIAVLDTFAVTGDLNGNGNDVDARGAVIIGPGAEISLSQLIVHDTLIVDPSATYTVISTVFAPGASPIPGAVPYSDVFIEGTQTLTDTLTASGDIHVLEGGVLTPNGNTVRAGVSLFLQDSARLVMATDDTVDAGQARFDGAASGTDLAGGLLRLRTGLVSTSNSGGQTFAPSGMVTEFYGGGTANIAMAQAGPSWSYFDSLRVIGATTIAPEAEFYVRGHALLKDGSTFDGSSTGSALVFAGKMSVLDSSRVEDVVGSTIFFYDSLIAAPTATYNVQNTRFDNTNGIPDLPYQYLTLGDGVHDTLTHPLTALNQLILSASAPGSQDLVLNGHTVATGDLSLGGFARITMDNSADTMAVTGPVLFGGDDLSGRLTAGVLRIGGAFTQNSSTSALSFASTGTRTEFYGTGTHSASFASPFSFQSHFGDLAVLDGGTLQPTTGLYVAGATTIDTSSIFDAQSMPNTANVEFSGKVQVLELGQLLRPTTNSNGLMFNDSLIVDPTASYSVFNSIFQGTDGIPDVFYTHLYLRQGVHLTLTHRLAMNGSLNIQNDNITGNPADTVTIRLNGNKISTAGLGITGYGRITMDNPADTLEILQDATFRGVDEDTALSAGVIRIGRGFAQNGQFSARSYAPAGTRTEFYGSLTHQASFTHSGIGESHFADLSVVDVSTLSPLTMFNVTGTTTIGSTAHFDGQGIPLGSVVDFHGPVTVQSGGDFRAATSPAFFNFYGNSGLTVLPGASAPYDVLNTGFVGNNNIPDLPYKNLYLDGTDSVRSNDLTAANITVVGHAVIDNGFTLHANDTLTVDGASAMLENVNGFAIADSLFTTINGGTYISQTAQALAGFGNVVWNGGDETGLLTLGGMDVAGDFTALDASPTFTADSLFTVTFDGGGNHDLVLSTPSVQRFGTFAVQSEATESDSVTLSFTGDLQMYRLGVGQGSRIIGTDQALQTEQLAVSGAAFQQARVHVLTSSPQPEQFDDVVFSGFSSTDVQLWIEHPGTGILDPTQFTNVDFDDAANPNGTTGLFVKANDTDGIATFLNLQIFGPDVSIGSALTNLLNGALVSWFGPA